VSVLRASKLFVDKRVSGVDRRPHEDHARDGRKTSP